mgnify:CR=1 FL=1
MNGKLKGRATKRIGDFMPPMPRGKIVPFKTRIFIYSPAILCKECCDAWHACCEKRISYEYGKDGWPSGVLYLGSQKPVFVLETNENGEFGVELEAGEYSVFVEYNGIPYVNSFSAAYAGVVEIVAGETLERDRIVNLGTD